MAQFGQVGGRRVSLAGADRRGLALGLVVALAYPVADVVVITIAWACVAAAYRASLALLIGGMIVLASPDSAFLASTATGSYFTGNPIDLGWFAGFGLIALAALRSVGERPDDSSQTAIPSRERPSLRYVPLLLAGGAGLAFLIPGLDSGFLARLAAVVIGGMLGRQFLVHVENQRLLDRVARQSVS